MLWLLALVRAAKGGRVGLSMANGALVRGGLPSDSVKGEADARMRESPPPATEEGPELRPDPSSSRENGPCTMPSLAT